MGGGFSSSSNLDNLEDGLSSEQKLRFQNFYQEETKKGLNEQKVREEIWEKLAQERDKVEALQASTARVDKYKIEENIFGDNETEITLTPQKKDIIGKKIENDSENEENLVQPYSVDEDEVLSGRNIDEKESEGNNRGDKIKRNSSAKPKTPVVTLHDKHTASSERQRRGSEEIDDSKLSSPSSLKKNTAGVHLEPIAPRAEAFSSLKKQPSIKKSNDSSPVVTFSDLKSNDKTAPKRRGSINHSESIGANDRPVKVPFSGIQDRLHEKEKAKMAKLQADKPPEEVIEIKAAVVDPEEPKTHCDLCNQTFKTPALLEKHIKFSELHAKMVREVESRKKQEAREEKILVIARRFIEQLRLSVSRAHYQKLKSNYSKAKTLWMSSIKRIRLRNAVARTYLFLYRKVPKKFNYSQTNELFEGSKFFWRSQVTLEIHMYLHDDENMKEFAPGESKVIEVIGFDPSEQKELQRLHVSYTAIMDYLKDECKDAIKQKQKKVKRSLAEVDLKKIRDKVVVDYIYNHLNFETAPARHHQKGKRLILQASSLEESTPKTGHRSKGNINEEDLNKLSSLAVEEEDFKRLIVEENAVDITPTRIHRRQSSMLEYNNAYKDMMAQAQEAAKLGQTAQMHSAAANAIVSRFLRLDKSGKFLVNSQNGEVVHLTERQIFVRKRWKRAIRKCISQIQVERVRSILKIMHYPKSYYDPDD
jgi:hypothetical protein